MIREADKPIVELIRTTIKEQDPTAEIILYGSRARGDATSNSDWDVIVLLNKPKLTFKERGNIGYVLWTKGYDIGEEINTFEFTKKEWEEAPPTMFKYNVMKDGIKL